MVVIDGNPRFPFQEIERFAYWANNIIQRREIRQRTKLIVENHSLYKTRTLKEIED